MPKEQPIDYGDLSGPVGSEVVYLLDAATAYEAKLLRRWLERRGNADATSVRIKPSRRRRGSHSEELAELCEGDHYLIPVRLVWLAPEKDGRRSVRWTDAFKPGDPRDPRGLRARYIRIAHPARVKMIAAEGATTEAVRSAYSHSDEVDGLGAFATRRAWIALDKVERRLRGNRYKIPRFVPDAILSRGHFDKTLVDFSESKGSAPDSVRRTARRYLREIAATHSPYVIDMIANWIHALYRQGYGEIKYSDEEVRRVAELGADYPVAFLPSHRSNLDRLSLQFMLWENDLPPNHTAGGINLNFFPIGPLLRRTGVFFIRRSFRENELYKIVLRSYLDYLVEKRFPIEWYLEGGRSRSGKLNSPRFGLLHYIVDAQRSGKTEDIMLLPISITYDQIQDVPDYAREAQGKGKESESIGWLLRAIRSLRRRYGDIYIRFGEAVSVSSVLKESDVGDETSVGLQKMAFEVMYRIGQSTPATPVSVVSIALLASKGKATSAAELADRCVSLVEFFRSRNLPTTETIDLAAAESVTKILDWLGEHGNVSSHEAVGRRVFWLDDDQMIRISYYRNMVVHFFVNRAIAELAMSRAATTGERDPEKAVAHMVELRDLLKFEFFFPDRERFVELVGDDLSLDAPGWEDIFRDAGPEEVAVKLGEPVAFWALLPILDAYQVVGDELESYAGEFEEKKFLQACLARARLYRIEEKMFSGESASQVLFKTALQLAANRDLLEDGPNVAARRAAFATEVREAREDAASGL